MSARSIAVGGLVVAVAVAAIVAAPGAGEAERPSRGTSVADCRTRGTTVVANRVVRIYRTGTEATGSLRYSACDTRRRRSRLLGRREFNSGVQPRLALSGSAVAFEDLVCDDRETGTCSGVLKVLDVPTGRTVQEVDLGRGGTTGTSTATDLLFGAHRVV